MDSKKPLHKKEIVKTSNHSKSINKISNINDLNQAFVHFLHHNEEWIHKYANKVNPKNSAIEQLASLIVKLTTNKLIIEGNHGLNSIMQAAFALAKKPAIKKAPSVKKITTKKPAVTKKAETKKKKSA